MRRLTTTLLIIVIGGLVLWEVLAQGTRTWTKYGLLKQPLPSIATLLDPTLPFMSMIMTISIVLTTAMITTMAVIRSRKLLGIIPVKELRRHALIVGPTGSGKTTIAKRIVEMAAKRDVRVTILDWKGEYTSYVKNAVVVRKVNIWDNGGRTPTEKAVIAVEMLREITRDIADVSSASAALLLKELIKLYREKETPTTKDVVDRLDRFMQTALAERRLAEANMAAALLRRLHWLLLDEESPDENENAYRNPAVTIYDLSSTSSSYLKTLYALAILSKKYYMALKTGTNNELLEILVAEEAQNFAYTRRVGEPPSMAERIIYELRGYGVGVILVCPDPELLPMAVLKDVGAVISTSPDTLPRFALERHLFRASLEEAEDVLKRLKKARMIVYFRGRPYFLRRLPKLPKVLKPKGPKPTVVEVKEEVTEGPKVVEVEEVKVEEKPRVLEVKVVEEKTEAESEAAEVEERPKDVEPLRLEEELEEPEAEVEVEKSPETIAEKEEKLEEPEPAPKAELRLEEEEEVKEEVEVPEESKKAGQGVSETPLSTTGGWELFGHLLVEDITRAGRYSVLRCVRCGAEASLLDLKTLKETPCTTTQTITQKDQKEVAVSLPQRRCENCGREAVASLCDICAETFERYAEAARPAPLRGRGGVRPSSVPGVDGWAWVAPLTTFFPFRRLEGGGREWWCPACKLTTKRLIDVADHFREAHPLLASRGWFEEYDAKTRRVRIRTWQGWVDEKRLEMVMENEGH